MWKFFSARWKRTKSEKESNVLIVVFWCFVEYFFLRHNKQSINFVHRWRLFLMLFVISKESKYAIIKSQGQVYRLFAFRPAHRWISSSAVFINPLWISRPPSNWVINSLRNNAKTTSIRCDIYHLTAPCVPCKHILNRTPRPNRHSLLIGTLSCGGQALNLLFSLDDFKEQNAVETVPSICHFSPISRIIDGFSRPRQPNERRRFS